MFKKRFPPAKQNKIIVKFQQSISQPDSKICKIVLFLSKHTQQTQERTKFDIKMSHFRHITQCLCISLNFRLNSSKVCTPCFIKLNFSVGHWCSISEQVYADRIYLQTILALTTLKPITFKWRQFVLAFVRPETGPCKPCHTVPQSCYILGNFTKSKQPIKTGV